MRRTFGFDVFACPRCGGRLQLLALIEQASTVEPILRHLGLPTDRPEPRPRERRPIASSIPTFAGTMGPRRSMPLDGRAGVCPVLASHQGLAADRFLRRVIMSAARLAALLIGAVAEGERVSENGPNVDSWVARQG